MSNALIWLGKMLLTIVIAVVVNHVLTKIGRAWKNLRNRNQVQEEGA